jgi:hypothetical protein
MAYLRGRTVKNSLLKNLSSITIAVFKSLVGQLRRLSDVGMSASPPDFGRTTATHRTDALGQFQTRALQQKHCP